MSRGTKTKEDSSEKKQKAPPVLNYDEFLDLDKNNSYFLTGNPLEMIAAAPRIKTFFVQTLAQRPYEEEEFYKLLEKKNPFLSQSLGYIQDQVDFDGENSDACKRALELIIDDVEVRVKDGNNYFGLRSKLDSA